MITNCKIWLAFSPGEKKKSVTNNSIWPLPCVDWNNHFREWCEFLVTLNAIFHVGTVSNCVKNVCPNSVHIILFM